MTRVDGISNSGEGRMLHLDRIPQRPMRDDVISLDHLGGIRAFIERCRIDSISDEMREIVETRWPDLARKLPRKDA